MGHGRPAGASVSRRHRRSDVLLSVTGGNLAHGLRGRWLVGGDRGEVRRGLPEESLDAGWPEEQQHACLVGIHCETVCHIARSVHEGSRASVDDLIAEPEPDLAVKYHEEFVVAAVDVYG